MNVGSITFSTELDNKELEKEYTATVKKIQALSDKISAAQAKRAPAAEQSAAIATELDAAKAQLDYMKSAGSQFSSAQISQQEETVSSIQARWNATQATVEKYDTQIASANSELSLNEEKAGAVAQELASAGENTEVMGKATDRASSSMDRFAMRVGAVVRSALVFTVITQALAKLRTWVGNVITTNAQASESVARLKAALLTLAQPLVNVIIPAFTAFVNILADVVIQMAKIVSFIFGTTINKSKESAEALNKQTEAINGTGTAAKNAAKENEKYLASFDEINQIGGNNSDSGNATPTSSTAPDFSGLMSGAASWLADLDLVFNGLKTSWKEGKLLQNKDAWITGLSGFLGAVIGGMFGGITGSVLGLLIGMSVGILSASFLDKLKNPDQAKTGFIGVLVGILGAIIGAKYAGLSGGILGVFLGLGIGIISADFEKMAKAGKWDANDTWNAVLLAILGAVIGGLFLGVSGAILGIQLGLTISIYSAKFIDMLKDQEEAQAIFRMVLTAILGAIIGAQFGGLIGGTIGLVLGLSIGFVSTQFSSKLSDSAKAKAKEVFNTVLTALLASIIGVMFAGVFGPVVGLTIALALGIASITVRDDSSSSLWGTDSNSGFGGGRISATSAISSSSIPALATGAVIPPNREFLATLGDQKSGTNIEAPEELIRRIVREETGGGGDVNLNQVITLDGEVVYRNQKKVSRRHGAALA